MSEMGSLATAMWNFVLELVMLATANVEAMHLNHACGDSAQ
jgi:hypothetical protein